MKYKLLAFDLDDTLLNEEFKISAGNVQSLRRAAEAGLIITIATGRMYRSAVPFARQLGINIPLITYHGALIKNAVSGEVIWHRPVPLEESMDIAQHAQEKGYHLNLFIDDRLHVAEENDFTRLYQKIARVDLQVVGNLRDFLEREQITPTKMNIAAPHTMPAVMADMRENFGHRVHVTLARPDFLEITHGEATKGRALRHLTEEAGFEREEVAAIGDSLNDVDMLEYAGTGVAVANAREEVKQVAQVITRSNLEDGVAYFVDNYILNS